MNFEEIEITAIEKLDLKAGDVLAVYLKEPVLEKDRVRIERTVKEFFLPIDIKVLVLAGEVKLQALRIEDAH